MCHYFYSCSKMPLTAFNSICFSGSRLLHGLGQQKRITAEKSDRPLQKHNKIIIKKKLMKM